MAAVIECGQHDYSRLKGLHLRKGFMAVLQGWRWMIWFTSAPR